MNENEKNQNVQPEKTVLDERKKNALLRYVAIMFAVAFVFVLLSMFGQMRDSKSAISELNQSSSSALQKAEALQEHNQELEKENAYLAGRIEELEDQLEKLEQELTAAEGQLKQAEIDYAALEAEKDQLLEQAEKDRISVETAYEKLLELQKTVTPGVQAGNAAAEKLAAEVKDKLEYLGDYALEIYENLTEKGE